MKASIATCAMKELATPIPIPQTPEFFRLPKKGVDPHFGCTRSWYLQTERDGQLKLVRLRQRGKLRGIVLIPFDAMRELIRKQSEIEGN